MAVKTIEEISASLHAIIGENTSDDALNLFEDIKDTFETLSDKENYKQKYEENDKMWREKYRDRFLSKVSDDDGDDRDSEQNKKSYTYENLFKEEK